MREMEEELGIISLVGLASLILQLNQHFYFYHEDASINLVEINCVALKIAIQLSHEEFI